MEDNPSLPWFADSIHSALNPYYPNFLEKDLDILAHRVITLLYRREQVLDREHRDYFIKIVDIIANSGATGFNAVVRIPAYSNCANAIWTCGRVERSS